jgi:hypothetical protein
LVKTNEFAVETPKLMPQAFVIPVEGPLLSYRMLAVAGAVATAKSILAIVTAYSDDFI